MGRDQGGHCIRDKRQDMAWGGTKEDIADVDEERGVAGVGDVLVHKREDGLEALFVSSTQGGVETTALCKLVQHTDDHDRLTVSLQEKETTIGERVREKERERERERER